MTNSNLLSFTVNLFSKCSCWSKAGSQPGAIVSLRPPKDPQQRLEIFLVVFNGGVAWGGV